MNSVFHKSGEKEESAACVFEQANVQDEYEIHLHENERRLKEAARLARLGHWELDVRTNELHWSEETFRIFELDPDEHEPSYETFLGMIHPDDRIDVQRQYEESVENRTQYNVYHRLTLKSGRVKFVNERCRTFYDDFGRPVRSLGTVLDMTDHEREIEKLVRAEAGLEVYAHGLEDEIEQLGKVLESERAELARLREQLRILQDHLPVN